MNLEHYILENKGFASVRAHKELRYQLCHDALKISKGRKGEAADLLGISRCTFKEWCNDYDMNEDFKNEPTNTN